MNQKKKDWYMNNIGLINKLCTVTMIGTIGAIGWVFYITLTQ